MAVIEGAHILVVEDEEHLATGIRFNLDAEGYRVTIVGDGPSALQAIEEAPDDYNLIVLDLMLPGMSGYAVCEALRSTDNDIPVLILSARTLAEDRTRGFSVGADQYLTKPFELDEFLSRVRGLLTMYALRAERRSVHEPAAVSILEFGEARVDFDVHEVTVAGEPVHMTPLELRLLRYFAGNEGRVIPRSELLEQVWDAPGNLKTRAPDQFIRRLRKIFEAEPGEPVYFLTVREIGYRFVSDGG